MKRFCRRSRQVEYECKQHPKYWEMSSYVYIHHVSEELMDQNGQVGILFPNDEFSNALYRGLSSLFTILCNLAGKVGRRERGIGKESRREERKETEMLISVMSGDRIRGVLFIFSEFSTINIVTK